MEIHDAIALLVAVVGGGGLIAYLRLHSEIQKTEAEAGKSGADTAKIMGDAWAALMAQMQTQLDHQAERMADQEARICELEKKIQDKDALIEAQGREIDELRTQVDALGEENVKLKEKVRLLEQRKRST